MGNLSIDITHEDYMLMLSVDGKFHLVCFPHSGVPGSAKTATNFAMLSLGALVLQDRQTGSSFLLTAKSIMESLKDMKSLWASCM